MISQYCRVTYRCWWAQLVIRLLWPRAHKETSGSQPSWALILRLSGRVCCQTQLCAGRIHSWCSQGGGHCLLAGCQQGVSPSSFKFPAFPFHQPLHLQTSISASNPSLTSHLSPVLSATLSDSSWRKFSAFKGSGALTVSTKIIQKNLFSRSSLNHMCKVLASYNVTYSQILGNGL